MYCTEFEGRLELTPRLNERQIQAINRFLNAVHGGSQRSWILGDRVSSNHCQWFVTADGKYLSCEGMLKFHGYVPWLHFLNKMFFIQWQVVLSGRVKWKGDDQNDVGFITAVPVTRPDGIRSTEIRPFTNLLGRDVGDVLCEEDEGCENCFLIFPGHEDVSSQMKMEEFEDRVSGSTAVFGVSKTGWRVTQDAWKISQYLKWDSSQEFMHGCVQWLQCFIRSFLPESQVLVGTVTLPGGLVIDALPKHQDGKFTTDIKLSSPLLDSGFEIDGLRPDDDEDRQRDQFGEENDHHGFGLLARFSSLAERGREELEMFMDAFHGDEVSSNAWVVPNSFKCHWRLRGRRLVWEGGDDLQGCIDWLYQIDRCFLRQMWVVMIGSVKLANGIVIKAEVTLKEVDRRGWVGNWMQCCRGNCGWEVDKQQQRPREKDFDMRSNCPNCGQRVLFIKRMKM